MPTSRKAPELTWQEHPGGDLQIGADAAQGFCFDNETPRHAVRLRPHAFASRLLTNAEFQAFIDDGGYRDPALWLSDGWTQVQSEGWTARLYWSQDRQKVFTLRGWRDLDPHAPVSHVSFYEADAYARWAGARLPTEAEWEAAADTQAV